MSLFRNIYFWILLVLVLGLSTGAFEDFYSGFLRPFFLPDSSQFDSVYLEIDFGERKRAFEGEVTNDMTILDALLASSRIGNFDVGYAILNDRADLFSIDGLTKGGLDSKTWGFYLNDKKIEVSRIHKYGIKPGDKILVKYE